MQKPEYFGMSFCLNKQIIKILDDKGFSCEISNDCNLCEHIFKCNE